MKYVSTRGAAPALGFADVLLTGLAADGGLYMPDAWPALADAGLPPWDASYADVAAAVMWPFVEGSIGRDDFDAIVAETYGPTVFRHPDVCPIVSLDAVEPGLSMCELFWGPTLAFKDVALQLVGRLFAHELSLRSERATIVVATSGDTGSAAIEACRGREALDIVVLHPHGRVSDVQRRQMTTIDAPNVHNVAIEGSFDDCQDLVKALFADPQLRDRTRLSAMNSINWARVMAQTVYYVTAQRHIAAGSPNVPIAFAVPTGNFGNVLAGWVALQMGLPIEQLVIGSNRNDILSRWLDTGALTMADVVPTLSPAMDIVVSSNLERLLFELAGRDGPTVADRMARFRAHGSLEIPAAEMADARRLFAGARFDDEETSATIRRVHDAAGVLVDPHTAVGIAAAIARRRHDDIPMIVHATAHPAKFPDAVEQATGVRPPLPDWLADLDALPERFTVLPNDLGAVRSFVMSALERGAGSGA